jgi:hypothetical protein
MWKLRFKRNRTLAITFGSVAAILGIAVFVLWYFPALTFHAVIFSDGPNNYGTVWETALFIRVGENVRTYASTEEARRAFDDRIAHAETIIQRTSNPAGLANVDEQVLGTFIDDSLNERRYCIVRLKKKNVYQTYAPSLRYALAFDKFRGDYYDH